MNRKFTDGDALGFFKRLSKKAVQVCHLLQKKLPKKGECSLGWTGDACDVDCGCNLHSFCANGVGECDECQDSTEGDHCEICSIGSYGNATTEMGL